jgi:hypothetical protein
MVDRRRDRRWPRQLEVRFWKQGEMGQGSRAISTNVSRTGIFVRTQLVLPSGTRLRIAVGHSGRDFTIEGVVMRALRSPAHLQSVMPSGMGVRFLTAEELLEELLPAIDFQAEERIPTGIESPSSSSLHVTPIAEDRPATGGFSIAGAAASPTTRAAATPTVPTPPPRTAPAAAANAQPISPALCFPLRFRDTEQFRRVFDRDVKTGGLFIHTSRPPGLDAVIEVEVTVDGVPVQPIRLQARVVHRMEPPPGSPPGNLLAGMGVQFVDVERAVERLRALLR